MFRFMAPVSVVMALMVVGAANVPAGTTEARVPDLTIARIEGGIVLDGRLTEPAWQRAGRVEEWYETAPGDNVAPKVQTTGYLAYDDRYLYVGFDCRDPDPGRIRAPVAANVRAGAAVGAVTVVAGWALASAPFIEPSGLLTWHRWTGVSAAGGAIGTALISTWSRVPTGRSVYVYRTALFGAAALVAIAGHLGGTLVWGADFFHP
jgi:hypothetical protein